MASNRTDLIICAVLFLLCALIFSQGLSIHGLEYRDDEIFYFKSTQEMVSTGDFWSPKYFGEDRFQKPILFYWLVLGSYKIFGMTWFGARFVAVIFASLTICVTWLMGKALFNRRIASLGTVILMTVPLFFRHAKNVVPDMALNFFIVSAMYCLVRFWQSDYGIFGDPESKKGARGRYSALFFVLCALGFMIKGFIAFIVPLAVALLMGLMHKNRKLITGLRLVRGLAISLAIICPWFIYMISAHGQAYLDYMLIDETKNRLIDSGRGNMAMTILATFFDHCIFYARVIGSYFAPWSVFLIGAIPLATNEIAAKGENREALRFLLAWFFTVFCFFSSIYFSINHYMLILSTPFALLVSFFFLGALNLNSFWEKLIFVARKVFPAIILTACALAFSFLFVFLAGFAKAWLIAFALIYLAMMAFVARSKDPMIAPMCLGLIIAAVFSQSALMEKVGVTSHSILQKFAVTAESALSQKPHLNSVIGVGSHDIHEKEFQAYFDKKVLKAANSDDDDSDRQLRELFSGHQNVLCLIIEKDYLRYQLNAAPGMYEILQEDYIMRRRMYIDGGFFSAILRMDQNAVNQYLREKIILVQKT